MKVFCETIFDDTLPAIRSIITNELINTYGLTQEQAAEKLGITQPAVSQYLSGLRGKRIQQITSNQKLMQWVKNLTAEIASGGTKLHEKICEICSETRDKKIYTEKEIDPFICLIEIYENGRMKNGRA
ncbi:MAG: helix-turn-helix domain-containing protein [Candidatus Aenigmarchaeota archaeon]|nr:helix-turn-helix domain-containing protein [Candidatus Aenigmarchaeota archaeon]